MTVTSVTVVFNPKQQSKSRKVLEDSMHSHYVRQQGLVWPIVFLLIILVQVIDYNLVNCQNMNKEDIAVQGKYYFNFGVATYYTAVQRKIIHSTLNLDKIRGQFGIVSIHGSISGTLKNGLLPYSQITF